MTRPRSDRTHLLSGTAWGLLGEGLALPTGLLTVVLLTRGLGASDYGLYTLTVGFVLLLQTGIGSLLSRATIKFMSESSEPDRVSTTALRLHLFFGVGLGAAVAMAAPALASLLGEPTLVAYLRLFAASLPIEAIANAHMHVLVGHGAYRQRGLARAVYWGARPVMVVGPVLAGYGVKGALVGAVLAPLAGLLAARRTVRPGLFRPTPVAAAPLMAFALPLFVSGMAGQLSRRLDLFALKGFGSTAADAGVYASAQVLAWIPTMLAAAFAPLLLSSMSRAIASGRPDRARALATDFLRGPLWMLPIAGAAAGAGPQIARLVYGTEFEPGGAYLAVLIFAGVAATLSATAGAALVVRNRLTAHVVGALLPLVVASVAFTLLIPRYGGVGAAVSTLLGVVSGVGFRLTAAYRVEGLSFPWRTALRCSALVPFAWGLAARGPQDGWLLVLKLSVVSVAALGALATLGEFERSELQSMVREVRHRWSEATRRR